MGRDRVLEWVGLAAVVAGLAFVGLEIRQNNRLAQAAAYQELGSVTAQNWMDLSMDPEFAPAFLSHFRGDSTWWAEQDSSTVARLVAHHTGSLRQFETIFLQVELGLLEDDAIESLGWGSYPDLAVLRRLWPWVSQGLRPTFARYITQDWAEVPPPSLDWYPPTG